MTKKITKHVENYARRISKSAQANIQKYLAYLNLIFLWISL